MDQQVPFWKKLLLGWGAIAARFGECQTLVILALFYGFLLGPVALGLRIGRRDYLDRRSIRAGGSGWRTADSAGADLERAKLLS